MSIAEGSDDADDNNVARIAELEKMHAEELERHTELEREVEKSATRRPKVVLAIIPHLERPSYLSVMTAIIMAVVRVARAGAAPVVSCRRARSLQGGGDRDTQRTGGSCEANSTLRPTLLRWPTLLSGPTLLSRQHYSHTDTSWWANTGWWAAQFSTRLTLYETCLSMPIHRWTTWHSRSRYPRAAG